MLQHPSAYSARDRRGAQEVRFLLSDLRVVSLKLNKDTIAAQDFYLACHSPGNEFKKVPSPLL
jgi:hypothetical protein